MLGLSVYLVAISGQMSFGQQGFFALGAYLAGLSTALWGLHLLPALVLGVVVAAAVGLLVGFPALRVRGLYLAIATFGFGEIVRLAFLNVRYTRRIGDRVVGPNASEGFRHVRYIYDRGITPLEYLGIILLALAVVVVLFFALERSKLGATLRAVEEDEVAASMVGINVTRAKVFGFTAAAGVAGLAGGLFVHYSSYIDHDIVALPLAIGPVSDAPILAIRNLSRNFGGLRALDDVSLEVPRGAVFALIGPNGSGKTTLFNVVTGTLAPTSGTILFQGEPIAGAKTHEIVRRGIGRTFQNIRLFTRMSVFDNVWVAVRTPRGGDRARSETERAEALLELTGLTAKRNELVENLNFGERRRLEMARALATEPRLLLLDEPAAGMGALELERLTQDIRRLRELGATIFLIVHTMDLVMGVADRIAGLNFGQKIAEGAPGEIQANQRVIEAYLGREGSRA